MLAFTTTPEPTFTGIDSIIKVNTKEVVTFNDSSNSPTSTTSINSSSNITASAPTPTSEFGNHHLLHNNSVIGFNHHSHRNNHPHHQVNGKSANNISASSSPSQFVPKTILKNSLNSSFQDKSLSSDKKSSPKYRLSDKMFAEEDTTNTNLVSANNNGANNGNANYLADTIYSNSNNITQTTTTLPSPSTTTTTNMRSAVGGNMNYDHHDLQLISHGLTDSVCETIKLLENDYDKKSTSHTATSAASLSSGISASSSSTSGGLGVGMDDHHLSNIVYTEEIVISTAKSNSSAVTGVTKPGIMKTFSSFSSSSSAPMSTFGVVAGRNKVMSSTEHWKNQLNEEVEDEEALSQRDESEETPLLAAAEQSSDTHHHNVSIGSDNVSNDSLGTTGGSSSAGATSSAPSSALHKMGKMTNGTKATGLKR